MRSHGQPAVIQGVEAELGATGSDSLCTPCNPNDLLACSTTVGGCLDLGRLVNYVCDFIDYRLEPRFPPLFWAIPGSQMLYNLIIPAEDEDQVGLIPFVHLLRSRSHSSGLLGLRWRAVG